MTSFADAICSAFNTREIREMTVRKVDDQGDRILLYGDKPNFHVIANAGSTVKVGDKVEYEPYGVNFGFMKRSE